MAPYFWKMDKRNKGKKHRENPFITEVYRKALMAEDAQGRGGVLRKGAWSPDEDKKLMKLVKKNGSRDWAELGAQMNRTGKSCRLRWHNHLIPDVIPVSKAQFTPEEDPILATLRRRWGKNRWSLIAGEVRGRTDNQVKNHKTVKQMQRRLARTRIACTCKGLETNPGPEDPPADDPLLLFVSIEGAAAAAAQEKEVLLFIRSME